MWYASILSSKVLKLIIPLLVVNHKKLANKIVKKIRKSTTLFFLLKKQKNKNRDINLKYKKYLIWPIKYIKHYKFTEYMKSTILSINMIGNEKQKTWQKNTIFKCKMLNGLCPC